MAPMRYIHRITAENFLSLRQVDVELRELNVLVGPNGAGKSNFLRTIGFLGDTARLDLGPAIERNGGFPALRYQGRGESGAQKIKLGVHAQVTRHSSQAALDVYELSFWQNRTLLVREESFAFKRTKGAGRRINVSGRRVEVKDGEKPARQLEFATTSAGLSTLGRLGESEGASQVRELADLFETFRVFDVDARAARRPVVVDRERSPALAPDARNLATFLEWLARDHDDTFELLQEDLRYMVPGLARIHLRPVGGGFDAVAIELEETALRARTPLSAASFGTVRALALLAMLHDPGPPKLTCVEEIDHGLHPYALDRIVERLRSATRRTQLLVATHSPALVNRLDPHELLVCERDPATGATLLPAIDPETVRTMASEDELRLGELWFSGALGGVL